MKPTKRVLILILLDHALRVTKAKDIRKLCAGLNPYFIGPCSPSNHGKESSKPEC